MTDFTTSISTCLDLTCLEVGDCVVCGQKLNTTFLASWERATLHNVKSTIKYSGIKNSASS